MYFHLTSHIKQFTHENTSNRRQTKTSNSIMKGNKQQQLQLQQN